MRTQNTLCFLRCGCILANACMIARLFWCYVRCFVRWGCSVDHGTSLHETSSDHQQGRSRIGLSRFGLTRSERGEYCSRSFCAQRQLNMVTYLTDISRNWRSYTVNECFWSRIALSLQATIRTDEKYTLLSSDLFASKLQERVSGSVFVVHHY